MGDSSAQYIHLNYSVAPIGKRINQVHHLIEECLLFNMSKEECMEALSKHANIQPIITSTVWKELEKENKEFFKVYNKKDKEEGSTRNREFETEITRQRIQKLLLDSSLSKDKP